jgi:dTDP-4-dehydrorhamnose 3,5-epimerase
MDIETLDIIGAFVIKARTYSDERGSFREWFRNDSLELLTGREFYAVQGNMSVSKRSVIRGVHFSNSIGGQDKFITALHGRFIDVIVDLRLGSPTFLKSVSIEMSPEIGNSLFIPSGVGHSFMALEDNSIITYLLSSNYDPDHELTINVFDEDLKLEWETSDPIISSRDQNAMSFETALRDELLSKYKP